MSLPKETSEKLEVFRANVASVAEGIVFRIFPAKTIELSNLIESASAPDSPYDLTQAAATTDPRVYPPPGTTDSNGPSAKRKRVEDGIVPLTNDISNPRYPELVYANKHVLKLQETIKAECTQLSDSCDKVKLWINLTMPKFLVPEVLSELLRAQESAYNIRDSVRQNYLGRAKICSKLIKYPNIEDYTLALKEHDEKQLFFARQNLVDIRNVYAVIMDIVHKNITKVRRDFFVGSHVDFQ
ncbi:proteasome activator pa28 REG alpha beta subunit [Chiua virens]|nr:proteasome activator pa28 REG alpha beta subunit [Chiua virens]